MRITGQHSELIEKITDILREAGYEITVDHSTSSSVIGAQSPERSLIVQVADPAAMPSIGSDGRYTGGVAASEEVPARAVEALAVGVAATPTANAAVPQQSVAVTTSHSTYRFGRASFVNFLWIKDEALFLNNGGAGLDIEMIDPGAFALEVYDSAGHLVSSGTRANAHGAWSSFDFSGGMNPPVPLGLFRLRLVNKAPGTRHVLQGVLTYG
jgi:hypothetical protein